MIRLVLIKLLSIYISIKIRIKDRILKKVELVVGLRRNQNQKVIGIMLLSMKKIVKNHRLSIIINLKDKDLFKGENHGIFIDLNIRLKRLHHILEESRKKKNLFSRNLIKHISSNIIIRNYLLGILVI